MGFGKRLDPNSFRFRSYASLFSFLAPNPLHTASYFRPSTDEPLSLGPGPFVQSLENAVGVTATICGKPTRKFFEACLKDMDDEVDHRGDEEVEKRNIIVSDSLLKRSSFRESFLLWLLKSQVFSR